jgi:hypothetical protein
MLPHQFDEPKAHIQHTTNVTTFPVIASSGIATSGMVPHVVRLDMVNR